MSVYCTKCGAQNEDYLQACAHCQAPLPQIGGYQPIQPPSPMYGSGPMTDWQARGANKKIAAGICAIVVGSLGVHKFVLGYQTEGIIMLLVSLLSCGMLSIVMSIIGIVEGITYLTKSDEDFVLTYVEGRKGWF
jgi:TM2 domain-containing membrane protein YozV